MSERYYYTDKIWKTVKGSSTPEELGMALFKNRISRDSLIRIDGYEKECPLKSIPDFRKVEKTYCKAWAFLLIAFAIVCPIVCYLAVSGDSSPSYAPSADQDRKANEFFSKPENREHFNKYMREERGK